uniref:Uncharacterized protein MANES_06G037000 n=1 Tax=Rhizophora mucronata TaxID=61149 RepID=A0A2P2JNG9_RHIMU
MFYLKPGKLATRSSSFLSLSLLYFFGWRKQTLDIEYTVWEGSCRFDGFNLILLGTRCFLCVFG